MRFPSIRSNVSPGLIPARFAGPPGATSWKTQRLPSAGVFNGPETCPDGVPRANLARLAQQPQCTGAKFLQHVIRGRLKLIETTGLDSGRTMALDDRAPILSAEMWIVILVCHEFPIASGSLHVQFASLHSSTAIRPTIRG
jgi:hypothetical protein